MDTVHGNQPEEVIEAAAAILAPIFLQNGWKWWDGTGPNGVPTQRQIHQELQGLVQQVEQERLYDSVRAGRLAVVRDPYDKDRVDVFLSLGTILNGDQC